MQQYRFERLRNELIDDLIPLYEKAFHTKVTGHFIQQKNSTQAFGSSFLGYIAYAENGTAAAFYGLYPCLIQYKNKLIHAAQSGDTMTHPDHQGKGLFTQLAKMTYEQASKEGIELVYGFPNQNSYPGFVNKLNWQHHEDIQTYLIRVYTLPWQRLKKWFGISEQAYEKYCKWVIGFFSPTDKSFENSVIDENTGGVKRNDDFFNYKTYSFNFRLKIANKTVWLKTSDYYLLIGDIERCDEKTFYVIIKKLRVLACVLGLPYIRFVCSPGSYYEPFFASIGKKHEITYPIGYLPLTDNATVDYKAIKYTTGDYDTF